MFRLRSIRPIGMGQAQAVSADGGGDPRTIRLRFGACHRPNEDFGL